MPLAVKAGTYLVEVLRGLNVASNSESRRMIAMNAVSLNGVAIKDPLRKIELSDNGAELRLGKRVTETLLVLAIG